MSPFTVKKFSLNMLYALFIVNKAAVIKNVICYSFDKQNASTLNL